LSGTTNQNARAAGWKENFVVSYKPKVRQWLAEARERLKTITPGTAWYRETEKIIGEYERLLQDMGDKIDREPGDELETTSNSNG
jgi:hypothetical protein